MNERKDNCVILFIREPIRGQVKTRLAAAVGADLAVELYRRFVEDTVSTLNGLSVPTRCYYDGPGGTEALGNWLGGRCHYLRQSGDGLGRKMANAFRDAFADGFAKVVLIGSDLPDLPAALIERAFAELQSHDAVIGPARDGGYYLIGFTTAHFLPEVFERISWSTERVFEQTMGILNSRGRKTHVLPRWHDVDTWSDLEDLIRRNASTPFCDSRTWAFARECGWIDDEAERSETSV